MYSNNSSLRLHSALRLPSPLWKTEDLGRPKCQPSRALRKFKGRRTRVGMVEELELQGQGSPAGTEALPIYKPLKEKVGVVSSNPTYSVKATL